MIRNPTRPLGFLIIILLFSSCYLSKSRISILEPAGVTLPGETRRVSILAEPGVPEPPGEFDSLKIIGFDESVNVKKIKMGYLDGARDAMSASPFFRKVVIADTGITHLLAQSFLTWELASRICQHDTTRVLLVLGKAVSLDDIESSYDFSSYSNGISQDYLKIVNHTKWVFYLPSEKKNLGEFSRQDSLYARLYFDDEKLENMLYQTCYLTGYRFGRDISPTWNDSIIREFYTGPGKEMRSAGRLAINNQWDQAASIWNTQAESENRTVAARASFNLAFVWERDDDLDQAMLWIAYSDSLKSTARSLAYKKILQLRLLNKALLDVQMNRE